jgi:hypothetical protein
MTPAIPASLIVNVIPGVLTAGGNPLSLNGLFLTEDINVPIGTVVSFPTAEAVADFFGPSTREAAMASIYFNGFDTKTSAPSAILFAQFNTVAVAAYLRSGSFEGVTLAQLQALSGVLTLTIDGSPETTANIDLSSASSFSNAAALIQVQLNAVSAGTTCTYSSQLNAFIIKSPTTGPTSTITVATGTLSTGLKVTTATGAVTSQGAAPAVEAAFMNAVLGQTQNWATFLAVEEPDDTSKLAFAAWVQTTNQRFAFIGWDSSAAPGAGAAPSSFGAQVGTLEYNGVFPIYDPTLGDKGAFVAGVVASVDFEATNGRITLDFKGQAGLSADVTDSTVYANFVANGYNVYARFATSNDAFSFLTPGSTPGVWRWFDAYVNQIWLNAAFQLAYLSFLTQINSNPYNQEGYNNLRVVAQDVVNRGLNNGVIRAGVTLSNSQKATINTAVGANTAAGVVERFGWLLDIKDANPIVRAARGSPPITFWYTDGGSLQKIEQSSIEVQ